MRNKRIIIIIIVMFAVTIAPFVSSSSPSIIIVTSLNGRPVNAFVQVFALLPPVNGTLIKVWNGTSSGGIAYLPLSSLKQIASLWKLNGDVGMEVLASYYNSTVYVGAQFSTYNPVNVREGVVTIKEIRVNLSEAKGIKIGNLNNSMSLQSLQNGNESLGVTKVFQTPSPPSPSPYCFWEKEWSWQSNPTYIPILWVNDQDSNIGGVITSFSTISTSVYLSFEASASIGSVGEGQLEIIGSSFTGSTSSYNTSPYGYPFSPYEAALYTKGTIGLAEFQLYCDFSGKGYYLPQGYYSNESYVQSADLNIYTSGQVGNSYVEQMINTLNKYNLSLRWQPFDEAFIFPNYVWSYAFFYQQQTSFPFSASIPIGAIAITLLRGQYIAIPLEILVGLIATIQVQSSTVSINYINVRDSPYNPYYSDLFVSQLNLPYYYNSQEVYPYFAGILIKPLSSYSSNVFLYSSGDTRTCPNNPVNLTYRVFPFISSSPS
jgi:hypothetical protein